jgi:hypothetical protein
LIPFAWLSPNVSTRVKFSSRLPVSASVFGSRNGARVASLASKPD